MVLVQYIYLVVNRSAKGKDRCSKFWSEALRAIVNESIDKMDFMSYDNSISVFYGLPCVKLNLYVQI